MRITRRTSAGRGEYEISEEYNGIAPRDLHDRRLRIALDSAIQFDSGVRLLVSGGKPRLRLDAGVPMQAHRQIAAALIMPHPVRSREGLGSGRPVLRADAYSIEHIELASVQLLGSDRALLRVGEVIVGNFSHQNEQLGYRARWYDVKRLWAEAPQLLPEIGALLDEHRGIVTSGQPIPERAERIIDELQELLTERSLDLGIVYRTAGTDAVPDLLRALEESRVPPQPPVRIEEVPPDEQEIRRRTVREWRRWASARGAASARFSQNVRKAYRWTCVVCGLHLPATRFNRIAGVDAAHILPWADYDLDVVSNGLCLCRQHHWAFDEGLFRIRHATGVYYVEIPEEVERLIRNEAAAFSLDALIALRGEIPEGRLPADASNRPNPQFLRALYESE